MPEVRPRVRAGDEQPGGIVGYPLPALYREVAFIAYHFHWSPQEVLTLEHAQRQRWVEEISAINERANSEANP
ncbi:DUF6760 family protein [Variovorax sp. RA8]|uniref:DUF6760 family protein n=1 Tax=Variovorax sp. (strain JCM 16519 / RA8) TaxID=662548 RepID=UPI0013190CB0|nr:hypothetical protein RA8CHR_03829 [Variovorax sp. RA8]